jgi:hypothetical protein
MRLMNRGLLTRIVIALVFCALVAGRVLGLLREEAEIAADPAYAAEVPPIDFGGDIGIPLLAVAVLVVLAFLLGSFASWRLMKRVRNRHVYVAVRPRSFVKIMPDLLSVVGRDRNDGILGTFAGVSVTEDGVEFWRGVFRPRRTVSIPRQAIVGVTVSESDEVGFMGGVLRFKLEGNGRNADLDFGILDRRLGFIVPMSSGRLRQLVGFIPVRETAPLEIRTDPHS